MKRILPINRLQFTLNVVLFTFFFCFSSLKTNAQTFSATWPFTSGLVSSVTGTDAARVTADAATYTSGTGGVFTGAVTTSTGFLNGTAISGKAIATCNSLYNSVGSTTPITPYIEFKLAPNPGYNMTTNSFNFTVEQTTAVSGTSIAAGFSVDGGSSFTGLAAPTGGGTGATLAASPTGTYFGTTAGILTFTVPAASIAATNSFILRIVIWRNNASNSSSANFKIAPPVITGSTTVNVSPVITAPAPGTLSNFNYIVGAGPSASQSFIVSGTNLSANLVVSPATDYEISSDNVSFSSTTPISITPASGSVPSTTLYARLIAGRATGTYNNEAINITSTGAIAQSVICSGFVTANYSYDGSGSLADVNNWGDNSDGSGNHPVNFTTNYQFFTIKNTTAVSTDAAWTVSGTGSKIIVGSATSAAVIVTISSVGNITGTIDLSSASSGSNKLVIANTAFLPANLGVLSASSILEFQATISSTRSTYENNILVSNGVFTHAPAAGAANVTGNVTVTGGSFVLAGTSASTIFGNVTVTGGTFMTNSSTINGNVNVSSAGIFNLNTGGAARSLTLNGNLSVSGTGGIINSGVPSSSGAVQSFNISLSGINKTIIYTASGGNLTKTNFYVIGSYALAGDFDFTSAGTTVFAAGQAFFTRTISILSTGSLSIGANTLKMGNSILDITAPGILTDEAASNIETTCAAFNAHAILEVNEPIAQLPILPSRTWLGTVKYIYSGSGNYGQKIVPGTYNNIVINNTLNTELSGSTNVNGTLTFTSGKIITGSNSLTLGTAATATGAGASTGWVVGSLIKQTASNASPSFVFAIGDTANYSPISLTFTGNNTATTTGSITASTSVGDHSQVPTSGINSNNSVNRTWTLVNNGITGFINYNAILNYAASDNDASSTPANYVVRKYDGTTWFAPVTVATPTATSATANGFVDFGDFAVGTSLGAPSVSLQPLASSICVGNDASFTATATTSTLPTTIKWQRSTNGTIWVDITANLDAGTTYSNFTTGTLTLTGSASGLNNYQYRAVFTSINGSTNSNAVALTVNTTAAPTASAQSFCNSGTVAGLTATGTGLQWYSAATGGTALASTTALASGNYFVSQTLNSCQGPRASVAVTVNTTAAPTASAQSFCNSGTVAGLTATGTGLQWYSAATGGTALASTTALASGNYFVSQTLNSCEGPRASVAVTVNTTAAPTASAQSFCNSGTVAGLTATGTGLQWYSAATGGTALASTTALASGNYFVSQTLNSCEGPRASVAVTVNTTAAPTASVQSFCNSGTVAGLTATGTGLQWYSAATGGTSLASTTALASGNYFVSQTLNSCEGPRASVAVTVNTTAAPTASAQSFCNSGTVAGLTATGTGLQWYSAATGGTALASTTALASGNYFVSQTVNSCEGPRASVAVTVNTTAAPTASAQSFCNSGTVAGLTATGTGLQWYSAATGGTALVSTTALASGNYFVSQTLNSCEGPRASVAVTVNTTAAPTASAQSFCNSGTVAGLTATGTGLQWYSTSTSGTVLASTTALATGTYFVSQTVNSCQSPRTSVAVTVNTTAAPTGAASQSLSSLLTISSIVVTGTNVVWYASSANAASGTNPLPSTTPLTNTTYYATQTVGGCTSATSLAVTITTLANQDFDMSQFSYSPNPVNDVLNLSYSQDMNSVKVYNMVGQELMTKQVNANTAQIDLSNFANGAYFIQVTTGSAMKTVRIIKR
jgi:hypothetical protein